MFKKTLNSVRHEADFCIVGGGMAGFCAALSAARNGIKVVLMHDRPVGEDNHAWECTSGDWIEYRFKKPEPIKDVTLILDSGLDKAVMMSYHFKHEELKQPPQVMPKEWDIEVKENNEWKTLLAEKSNYMRHRRIQVNRNISAIRFKLNKTWGAEQSRVYGFYVSS